MLPVFNAVVNFTVWLNVFGQVEEDPRNTCLWRSFDVCGRLWTSRRIQVQHLHFLRYDCKTRLEPQSTSVPIKVFFLSICYTLRIILSYYWEKLTYLVRVYKVDLMIFLLFTTQAYMWEFKFSIPAIRTINCVL